MKNLLKVLALFLALTMVFGLAACGDKETASSDESKGPDLSKVELWDGTVAVSFAQGTGSEEDPYIISNGSELAFAIKDCGIYNYFYKLSADIYLNDVSNAYWFLEERFPWDGGNDFSGTIDGDGHCIYGIWFDNETRPDDAGLVNRLKKGGFKNLGIRYSYVSARQYAGAFAGRVTGQSVFDNCFADDTVYVQYTDMGHHGAGGIMGYACAGGSTTPTIEISNCYSKANVLGMGQMARVNGIIGTSWNCAYTMENCYSYGLPPYRGTNESTVSYLLKYGWKTEDVYKNIYTDTRAPIGLEDFTLLASDKMQSDMTLSDAFEAVDGSTPKLKVFADVDGKPAAEIVEEAYFRYLIMSFSGGNGTESDPFVITTAEQLHYVVEGHWENTYFKLGSDIHVNDVGKSNWQATAETWSQSSSNTFGGYFDGNGHSVYGVYYKDTPAEGNSSYGTALFPKITPTAKIKNVTLKDSNISGKGSVGGIVGLIVTECAPASAIAEISNCHVEDSVVLNGYTAGGVLGSSNGKVDLKDCTSNAKVTSVTKSEGIIGGVFEDQISF